MYICAVANYLDMDPFEMEEFSNKISVCLRIDKRRIRFYELFGNCEMRKGLIDFHDHFKRSTICLTSLKFREKFVECNLAFFIKLEEDVPFSECLIFAQAEFEEKYDSWVKSRFKENDPKNHVKKIKEAVLGYMKSMY